MRTLALAVLLFFIPLQAATSASTQPGEEAAPPIEYTVDLSEAHTQMIGITITIRDTEEGTLEVVLPVWRPGKYQVIDPAGSVRDVTARSLSGGLRAIRKKDKSTWIIETRGGAGHGGGGLVLRYRVYANSIADRTRHADDTHAFLSPSSVFMYAPTMRSRPLRVRIVEPEGSDWTIATGLERDPRDRRVLLAPNYDVLVDSPIEVGEHEVLHFEVEGIPHDIAIWNPSPLPRTLTEEKVTGDFEKIVRTQLAIFGKLPYERYVFLIHCYPAGGGGTEHLNSTIMGCKPEALRDDAAFKKFLGLVSHEFFHTWNVKQFRPAGIHPYDYSKENYTDLLWVAEGTTSYYDDLTLARTGVTRPDDYLKTLSGSIDSLRKRPGARVQSLAESSFDAWIKFNKSTPDSVNSTVSFYDKGALVSFLLDMQIRRNSDGRHTLDDLMRDLYERFPLDGPGYTHADIVEAAERLAGADLGDFFARTVEGTGDLPFEDLVAEVGLELTRGGPDAKSDPKPKAYLGLELDGSGAVSSALADGPAYAAGIVPSDAIIAANDQRVRSGGDLNRIVEGLKPGDELRLTYFRYDTLREAILILGEQHDGRWTLRRLKEPTDPQREAYRSWIGQDWPAEPSDEPPADRHRPGRKKRNP